MEWWEIALLGLPVALAAVQLVCALTQYRIIQEEIRDRKEWEALRSTDEVEVDGDGDGSDQGDKGNYEAEPGNS